MFLWVAGLLIGAAVIGGFFYLPSLSEKQVASALVKMASGTLAVLLLLFIAAGLYVSGWSTKT